MSVPPNRSGRHRWLSKVFIFKDKVCIETTSVSKLVQRVATSIPEESRATVPRHPLRTQSQSRELAKTLDAIYLRRREARRSRDPWIIPHKEALTAMPKRFMNGAPGFRPRNTVQFRDGRATVTGNESDRLSRLIGEVSLARRESKAIAEASARRRRE